MQENHPSQNGNSPDGPAHAHYYRALASINKGHAHALEGFTFPVNGSGTDGHVHTFTGITSTIDGHFHVFYGTTGPAIWLPDGSHYHEISGKTGNRPLLHFGNRHLPAPKTPHDHPFKGWTGRGLGYGQHDGQSCKSSPDLAINSRF